MSLQLVCINYGSFDDALNVVEHCMMIFPRFEKATVLHPNVPNATFSNKVSPGYRFTIQNIGDNGEESISKTIPVEYVKTISPTQNECCLYEMPQYITCDHAIGIQWDGFIVNPDAWTDEFLDYDYIAPPWPLTNIVNPEWRVGSGGCMMFSKKMAQLWGSLCAPHPEPNDWQMGAIQRASFEKRGIKFAPLELAMRWGEEIPLDDQKALGYTPFTFHGFQYGDHEKYRKMIYG